MAPVFGNPVNGIIRPPGSPVIVGSFRVTSTFAEHVASGRGEGIDIGDGTCGKPVLAMAGGKVTYAGYMSAYDINGNRLPNPALVVRIAHPQFPGYETGYAHLGTKLVNVGNVVSDGQQIGTVGSTGATACHLHGGCKYNGVEVDWWPFLIQNGAGGGDMLQGTFVRAVENRKVRITAVPELNFRSSPFVKPDNIIGKLPTSAELHPDFVVTGTKVGAAANAEWYGAWWKTSKGLEFGYASLVFCSAPAPIEQTGHTDAELAKAAADAAAANEAKWDKWNSAAQAAKP